MANHVKCPKCGGEPKPVSFTWWGGILGPKLLSHVKCGGCGTAYNGKSGKSNSAGIAIYIVVTFVIAFIVAFALCAGLVGN